MPVSIEELKNVPYFANLDATELSRIKDRVVERSYTRGDILIMEGEPCPGFFLVRSGKVRIFKTSEEGKEQVLRIMTQGDSFNEVPVFDGGPNPASVEAMEPATVYMIPKTAMIDLVRTSQNLALSVVRILAMRLRHLSMLVEDLSFKDVTRRVAKVLLENSEDLAAGGTGRALTQQQIAAMAGTVREMVGRALKSLEERGAIRVEHGRITILRREALERLI